MPDKSGYNLFNPVPENLLRDLSPDRPDATESPYTVDAGHYQLEMDFANFTSTKRAAPRPRLGKRAISTSESDCSTNWS